MSVSFEQSARAKQVLEELCLVIEEGYAQHTLQRSPHLTLLNEEWHAASPPLRLSALGRSASRPSPPHLSRVSPLPHFACTYL